MTIHEKKSYTAPRVELDNYCPDILCDSYIDGGLEDLTEEEWTL